MKWFRMVASFVSCILSYHIGSCMCIGWSVCTSVCVLVTEQRERVSSVQAVSCARCNTHLNHKLTLTHSHTRTGAYMVLTAVECEADEEHVYAREWERIEPKTMNLWAVHFGSIHSCIGCGNNQKLSLKIVLIFFRKFKIKIQKKIFGMNFFRIEMNKKKNCQRRKSLTSNELN